MSYAPQEIITKGRATSVQSAKRLTEIERLENINAELLEALSIAQFQLRELLVFLRNQEACAKTIEAIKVSEKAMAKVKGE